MRGLKSSPSRYVVKTTNLQRVKNAAAPSQERVVRHPSLKHELKGPIMTHSEHKLDAFARNNALFKQRALSKEQIELHDRLKNMTVPDERYELATSARKGL